MLILMIILVFVELAGGEVLMAGARILGIIDKLDCHVDTADCLRMLLIIFIVRK